MSEVEQTTVVIASGGALSTVFRGKSKAILGVYFPTGVLGSRFALQKGSSEDTSLMRLVCDELGEIIRPMVTPNGWLEVHPYLFKAIRYGRIQMVDDAGAAVAQNADRTLVIEIG